MGFWDFSFFMNCHFHPDRLSVEICEVCRRPMCAECLWYADSGERLCPVHGEVWQLQGKAVHPPERYAEGIGFSQVSASDPPKADLPYKGNGNDLNALIALILGISSVLACYGFWYILPLIAFLMGLVAWLHARDSHNPNRTKWLAGGAMASGGIFLLLTFGFIILCLMCYVFTASLPNTNFANTTPTPFRFPTATP